MLSISDFKVIKTRLPSSHEIMSNTLLLLLSALCVLNFVSSADIFHIEHSLDGGVTFRKRSSFQHSATGEISMETSSESIIQEEVEAFKALLSTNSMYTLRIIPHDAQANNCSSAAVYAAIPAVRMSGYRRMQITLLLVMDVHNVSLKQLLLDDAMFTV